jgi:flagellar biosynthesis protein FliQ
MTMAYAQALRDALYLVLLCAAPPVVAVLLVAIGVALLETATQVRDSTLATVPKVVAALLALALAGPFIGARIVGFARAVLEAVPALGRS